MITKHEAVPTGIDAPVTVIVSGGVVQDILHIPEGMTIRVQDYDVDGLTVNEAAQLQHDEDGTPYLVSLWEGSAVE